MDENKLKQAQAAYKTLCDTLDAREIQYQKDDEHLGIFSGATGDDLPIPIIIHIDVDRMLIVLNSQMLFEVPEERRCQMAVAISRANYGIPDGGFDYDFLSGNIIFRLTSCYRDSLIGQELFEYMLVYAFGIVDQYNDLFEKVATTDMTVEEILKTIE